MIEDRKKGCRISLKILTCLGAARRFRARVDLVGRTFEGKEAPNIQPSNAVLSLSLTLINQYTVATCVFSNY